MVFNAFSPGTKAAADAPYHCRAAPMWLPFASLAPGYADFQAFCLEADILATSNAPLSAITVGMVSDDNDNL